MKDYLISITVKNEPGVLMRISNLFSKRAYNIDSLTVGEAEDNKFAKITISTYADEGVKDQIISQLEKMYVVSSVQLLTDDKTFARELMLVQIKSNNESQTSLIKIACDNSAKIVNVSDNSIMFEISGDRKTLNNFLKLLKPFGDAKFSRTGVTAMSL